MSETPREARLYGLEAKTPAEIKEIVEYLGGKGVELVLGEPAPELPPSITIDDLYRFADEHGYSESLASRAWNAAIQSDNKNILDLGRHQTDDNRQAISGEGLARSTAWLRGGGLIYALGLGEKSLAFLEGYVASFSSQPDA